jgi:hypothetical protein
MSFHKQYFSFENGGSLVVTSRLLIRVHGPDWLRVVDHAADADAGAGLIRLTFGATIELYLTFAAYHT